MAVKITPSAKAKAAMKAAVAKDQQAKAKQDQSPLKSRADMKSFAAQYPKAFHLLGVIFDVGRGSSSRRPGVPGRWAAYTYQEWSERAKMPVATLKRHLDVLGQHGLIERARGHHQGTRVISFIRPTALALKLSTTRPTDWDHFGHSPDEPATDPNKPKAWKPKPIKTAPKTAPDDPPLTAEQLQAIDAEDDAPLTAEQVMAILNDDDTPASVSTSSPTSSFFAAG